MSWDAFEGGPPGRGRSEPVELVGPHLRVSAMVDLLRFTRLVDLVNHSRGYVRIHEARLLRRNGEPTPLVVPELYVNQDEITFIAQATAAAPTAEPVDEWSTPGAESTSARIPKYARRFVVFTPGHAIVGTMDVFREMTVANFVDSTEPRFVPLTAVTARSLADRRVVSKFDLLLVNRTQMTAVALEGGDDAGPADRRGDNGVLDQLPEDPPISG
ncbi:MAG: hypothetical protein M3R57_08705 [Chloroflexota bacterium]|nr:hypothetical protein [Chloroflexota bacterium]